MPEWADLLLALLNGLLFMLLMTWAGAALGVLLICGLFRVLDALLGYRPRGR